MKAIETSYGGYRFRSRLEARWAVFFDALGVKWGYEPEGYDLGDAGWYLPDFWLPDYSAFLEVKPINPTPDELLKMQRLAQGFAEANKVYVYGLFAIGIPSSESTIFVDALSYAWCEEDNRSYPGRAYMRLTSYALDKFGPGSFFYGDIDPSDKDIAAYNTAKAARFGQDGRG